MSEPTVLRPESESEVVDVVRRHPRISPCGNQTKPAMIGGSETTMIGGSDTTTRVSLSAMTGVVEYEPSEFTFTAKAGTRIEEINAVLAERNQCLPFDPMLVHAGATLGGTMASGLSGPGRFRFGGLRDFVIGCTFVSGEGKVIHSGGKVVKNAAGFDIPKLMVGSLGRLGLMTELTFKVFPKPVSTVTLLVHCDSDLQLTSRTSESAASRWELDAIDSRRSDFQMYLRLAGPAAVNQAIASEISDRWGSDVSTLESGDSFWRDVNELSFATQRSHVVKVPGSSESFADLDHHESAAGNVVWIATDDVQTLGDRLIDSDRTGLVVRGSWSHSIIGKVPSSPLAQRIKSAMDPQNRFGE